MKKVKKNTNLGYLSFIDAVFVNIVIIEFF